MIDTHPSSGDEEAGWQAANRAYVELHLQRLRLLLHRRALWLRELVGSSGRASADAEADQLFVLRDARAESSFYQQAAPAIKVGQRLQQVELALAERLQEMAEAGRPAALEVLGQLLNLSAFERQVLMLCLGPELDPAFARLYAYVQDDDARTYATPSLALALFADRGEGWAARRASFGAGGRLRRFSLIAADSSRAASDLGARPLFIDERIGDYLVGLNRPDARLEGLLRPLPAAPLTADHVALVKQVHDVVVEARAEERGPSTIVNLFGTPGSGQAAVAHALCDRLGLQACRLDLRRLPIDDVQRRQLVHLIERECALLQLGLYLDVSSVDGPIHVAEDMIEDLGVFSIIVSRQRWQAERPLLATRVTKPDSAARQVVWADMLAGAQDTLDGHVTAVAHQFDFEAHAIVRAAAAAQNDARLRGGADGATMTADDLWQACREQVRWDLDDLAQCIAPTAGWDDIVLPDDARRQLHEVAAQVAQLPVVYDQWGFGARLSRGRGISALFSGPSGTGKTMAAEVLAGQLRLDLYRVDLAGLVSKYIGETEKNLRRVFDAAEQGGAILFFDEADALFGKRSEVKDSHDRYANIEVSYLLQRMEAYRGLAILATNMKSHLDQAFLRRLRFVVDFPFPDTVHRLQIWQKAFPPQARCAELDFGFLARLEVAGGSIKNIVLNGAFLAADSGGPIRMEHLIQATRREYAKLDKLLPERELERVFAETRS